MKKSLSIICLSLLLLTSCGKKDENATAGNEPLAVKTEKAVATSDYASTPYVGVVEQMSTTMVSFNGMGVLKQVNAREGQSVKKGQLLATIDDSQSRNALTAAKAALEQALDAESRMKQLHDKGSLPDMKWIEVESQVQQARATYAMCQKSLADCAVYAPCSGVVGDKIMGVGETALPAEPVLTILDISSVKVKVSIPEKEIARISAGTQTSITVDALGGETFSGGQIEKGVSGDVTTHTYNIFIHLPNADHRLLPGMVANVRFTGADMQPQHAITLPVRAVQQSADGKQFVWVVKDKKAHRQNVSLGETSGNRIAITDGLSEGMDVVVEGYQKLSEGSAVK